MNIHRTKSLFVFDFDDTLCHSDSHTVYISHKDGTTTHLPGSQWAEYQARPGDIYDFSDFEHLKNPRPNTPVWHLYNARIAKYGNPHVWICTARGIGAPLIKWLVSLGIENPQIACMSIPPGDNNGIHKARFIYEQIQAHGYGHVEFYDDRKDCVHEVSGLKKQYPAVNFTVGRVEGGTITYL